MISIDEARDIIVSETQALDPIRLELAQAAGHVLAESVVADRDFPPTDRSAMDGFAVRAADLAQRGRTLRLAGEVRAGAAAPTEPLAPGQAMRIFTGGVVPPGADAVVMIENTSEDREAGTVLIDDTPAPGQHVRHRASDLSRGDRVLEPGIPIHAAEIAALASVGQLCPRVFRQPVVHLLSTGDEVVEPEVVPAAHQIRNSNGPALLAQLREAGLTGHYLGIAPDSREALREQLRRGLSGDVLIVTGGVSVGEYDMVAETLADEGMRLLFHKVSMKPGKPILVGRAGSCLVFGLPGNPVSTFAGFAVFVAPALRRLMGYQRWENLNVSARLEQSLRNRSGRTSYQLVRLTLIDGRFLAHPVRTTGSGDVLSMSQANAFVILPADVPEVAAGTELPAVPWADFHLR